MESWSGGRFCAHQDCMRMKRGVDMARDMAAWRTVIDAYLEEYFDPENNPVIEDAAAWEKIFGGRRCLTGETQAKTGTALPGLVAAYLGPLLDELLDKKAETFAQKLLSLMKKQGLKPAELYRRANVDKSIFSRIVHQEDYQPAKDTVLALILALGGSKQDMRELLSAAGYALAKGRKRDIIIQAYLENAEHSEHAGYDIDELNIILDAYGFPPLTGKQNGIKKDGRRRGK